jgi:ribosomal protein S18 acetylase RimI-like enzyme
MLACKRHDGAREIHKAFLWGFFVEPSHRRSGLASALMKAGLDAAQTSVEQVLLTVVADNRPAIALYERFGFRPYGLEPRSLKTAGAYTDELLMILFLADRLSLEPLPGRPAAP